jgi:hypothetical protein
MPMPDPTRSPAPSPVPSPSPAPALASSAVPVPPGQAEQEAARLAAGIAALTSFQQVTQQGDGKANMLLAVHVGLTAVVATQIQQIHQVPRHGATAIAFWVVLAVYLTSFAWDGYLIAQVVRPRSADLPPGNPLALPPVVPAGPAAGPVPRPMAEQLWETARAIGTVAALKNAYLAKAVVWTAVMVVSAVVWLCILAALAG